MTCGAEKTQTHLHALIALAFDRLAADLLKHWHESGHESLTLSHFLNVLRFVSIDGVRPARMAEQAGVSQQAISLLIKELSELGYVERGPDPTDRRAQVVRWSRKGETAARQTERWFAERELAWRASLGDRAVDGAMATLALIVREESDR